MPTATMTFTLPDEQHEFEIHTHAADFADACRQVDDKCRAFVKWHENPSRDAVELAEEIREMLREALASCPTL